MTFFEALPTDMADVVSDLRRSEQPFAFATIVRTAGATAAKPGAKAVLSADGTILHGWLGGGCTRGAVKRAALEALQSGTPQLISVAPEELLAEKGVTAGEELDGTKFARNGCPSKGSIDIFIEPYVPVPVLTVIGGSPVAEALARLAPQFQWAVSAEIPEAHPARKSVIVIATQGAGDLDALSRALDAAPDYVAFVGSRRKYAALSEKLAAKGATPEAIAAVNAPAGLDIGAVTPEEIALSILAELVQFRRRALRQTDPA
jgi:xanthine dehydrogenase accessory factor